MICPDPTNLLAGVLFAWTSGACAAVALTTLTLHSCATKKAKPMADQLAEAKLQNAALKSWLYQMALDTSSIPPLHPSDSKPCLCKPSPASRRRSTTKGTSAPKSSHDENVSSSSAFETVLPERWGI